MKKKYPDAGDTRPRSSQVEWDLVSQHFLEEIFEPEMQGEEGNRVAEKVKGSLV